MNIRTQVKALKTATMVIIIAAVLIVIAVAVAGCGKTHYKTPAPLYKVSSNANIPGYETPTAHKHHAVVSHKKNKKVHH